MPPGPGCWRWPSTCGGCRPTTTPIPTPPTTRCASTPRCIGCPTAAISSPATPTASPSTRTRPPIPPTRSASSRPSTATGLLYRAPHHQPRLQRSAAAHARAPDHRRGASRRAPSPTWRRPWSRWSTACSTPWPPRAAPISSPTSPAAVPVEVIGNLLAVPRDERGPLRDWSLAILGALEPVLTRRAARARRAGGGGVPRLSAPAGRRPARASGRSRAATCSRG